MFYNLEQQINRQKNIRNKNVRNKKNKSLYSQVCVFFVTEIPAKRKQTMKKSRKEPEQTLIYMERGERERS